MIIEHDGKNPFKNFAEILQEDIKKFGKIEEDGAMVIDDGVQKQVIGKAKVDNLKQSLQGLTGESGLKRYYMKILKVLKEYIDLEDKYYSLIAVWILGTYLHKQFPAYPYLFFNAMKGSGKTRTLKIISQLSKKGKVAGSMTEAVLFRTASQRTLCIDEFESMNAKGNENLKLLLNSAYKKGTTIERMAKRNSKEGEEQIVEEFEVYCPIAIANIWGMENVLGDRCIEIILEKSNKNQIIKLIENFEHGIEFQVIRGGLLRLTENINEDSNIFGHVFNKWNFYQKRIVSEINNVNEVKEVNNVNQVDNTYENYDIDEFKTLFSKINQTGISGRELELFLPLFIISDMVGEKILLRLLELSRDVVKKKRESDREDNKDVKLIEFLAQSPYEGFVNVSDVAKGFIEFTGDDEKFNTARSISRALNRLNLIMDKKSTGKKRQVKLDIIKAQEKLLMFKEPEIDFSQSKIKEDLEDG